MTNNKNPVMRLLERRDFPLPEIVMAAIILSLSWQLFIGGVFRSEGGNLARINHQRMTLLNMAVQTYKWADNSFPSSLGALVCEGQDRLRCIPLALPELMSDVWGTPYGYQLNGKNYTLKSLAADRKEGGAGPDADIMFNGP